MSDLIDEDALIEVALRIARGEITREEGLELIDELSEHGHER